MSVKILSQAGMSLADTYNVKGSVIGIDRLEAGEVTLVHEMGATIFSERFSTFQRRAVVSALGQSVTWNSIFTDLPAGAFKIFGISIEISVGSRVDLASLAIRQIGSGREMIIWAWDSSIDQEVQARHSTDGGVVGTHIFLRPAQPIGSIPHMMAGTGQPQTVSELAFRGRTPAFGAGTVEVTCLVHIGFSQIGGISSRGLPIPSW